jgi:predicted AAA+ superfamily ATPase
VITGVRRCGKSTLLRQFADDLVESGADPRTVIAVNLEDPAFRDLLERPMALYDHIVARLSPEGLNTVFIDELQLAPEFERVADGLFVHPLVDLYVTGSNARLLSGDLATLLAGRYTELPLWPLGFADYVQGRPGGETPRGHFNLRRSADHVQGNRLVPGRAYRRLPVVLRGAVRPARKARLGASAQAVLR